MNKFSLIRLIFYSPLFYILRIYSSTPSSILYNKVDWQGAASLEYSIFPPLLPFWTILEYSPRSMPQESSAWVCVYIKELERLLLRIAILLQQFLLSVVMEEIFFCKFPQIPAKKLLGNLNSHHHLNLSKCPQYILISLLN